MEVQLLNFKSSKSFPSLDRYHAQGAMSLHFSVFTLSPGGTESV